jgi:hypothetical protein
MELIWNLLKQKISARNVSSVSLKTLKEITQKNVDEITHEDWMKVIIIEDN